MRKTLASLGIFFFVVLLFFWPIFKGYIPFPGDLLIDSNPYRSLSVLGFNPGSYPNKAQGMDVVTEMYPWRYFTIQELKQGRIPFWNPHNFSGNIHMQNFQSSIFNPFNAFFFLFSFNFAWTLFIMVQPLLASIFFYLFARELKASRFAAVIGGIAFAFSAYMTVWIEYGNIAATLAYLPLLLFFLIRYVKTLEKKYYAGFVISGVLLLLSGYIQGAFYSYGVAGAFVIVLLFKNKKILSVKRVFIFVSMFLLPVFLTFFQLFPTVQVFSQSSRWPYSLKQFQDMLQPIWYWITLFSSDFFGNPAARNYYLSTTYIERVAYIGIPILLFSFLGITKKRPFLYFFLSIAIIVLLLTTNIPGISYFYLLPIPVINTTVPTRLLSIFMFAGIVLAVFGIDSFFIQRKFPKKLVIGFGACYALLWGGLLAGKHFFPQFTLQISVSLHNLFFPTFLLGSTVVVLFLATKYQRIAKVLLLGIIIADLFYGFQKITPFAPSTFTYPTHPVTNFLQKNAGIHRYWGYGSGYIFPNIQTVDGTYSPEGNDPLHMKNYGELVTSSYDGKLPTLPPRPDANLAQGYGQDGMKNPYRQKLLNLLGVKYIVQHDEILQDGNADTATFPKETYELSWSQSPWQVYENKAVFPRYFLVDTYVVAVGQKALNALYANDLRHTVILNMPLKEKISSGATGSVKLLEYSPQKITFQAKTTGTMILFLSDTYYPSWNAIVDGKPTSIFLADYAFRGLVVPAGQHTINMYYQPQYFYVGLGIAGIALIAFLLLLIFVV